MERRAKVGEQAHAMSHPWKREGKQESDEEFIGQLTPHLC